MSLLRPHQLRCEYLVDPRGIESRHPRVSWRLKGSGTNRRQSAYQIQVATSVQSLKKQSDLLWDSNKVVSDLQPSVRYAGPPIGSGQTVFWRVQIWDEDDVASGWSNPAHWQHGLSSNDWEGAEWIAFPTAKDAGEMSQPTTLLRHQFTLPSLVVSATLYASALGLYEITLNGAVVGDRVLTPGWSDYNYRAMYQAYDVSELLAANQNVIAATIADGWYCGYLGFENNFSRYGDYPALRCRLDVTCADGSKHTILTNKKWKARDGFIRAADFYMGATIDYTRIPHGWETTGFDDKSWKTPKTVNYAGLMSPDTSPPLRVIDKLPVTRVTQPSPKIYIVDFGQIYAGYMRLKVNGPKGHKIVVRYGEILNPDGTLHTVNLRAAKQTDTFILDGQERWIEPNFTYKGFRYVEITGLDKPPQPEQVEGLVMHVDAELTGEFRCSDPLLNQLWKNIRWGQRGNFMSVPTDCPQRDERLGWTGDMQIYVRTGIYQMDCAAYLTKWMRDVRDGQHDSGAFPDVAPRIVVQAEGAPAWGDCGVVVPWTLWRMYGDTEFISENYNAMQRWMQFLLETNPNLRRMTRRGNDYGDWVAMDSHTARDLIGTAYWAHDATLMAQMATAIGRDDDAAYYTTMANDVRAAFHAAHVFPEGAVVGDITQVHSHLVHLNMQLNAETQTNYALAINLDLLKPEQVTYAADRLVRDITRRGNHLSTGFVGTMHLLPALTKGGRNDIAYRLLRQQSFPSWLYPVTQGATTMWERWDSWHHEFGLQTPTMNSFNHFAYGCVGDWMMRTMVGICDHPDHPGFRVALIAPQPGGDITTASGSYNSQFGTYKASWKQKGSHFSLTVTIPVGCEAEVRLPTSNHKSIRLDGQKVPHTDAIILGSGSYEFTCII